MFQDGSCECPKLNHRRQRRAQSETARQRQQARRTDVRTLAGLRIRRCLASGRTRVNACAVHLSYRPWAGRRPSRSSRPRGDGWAPERRLDRHRTGRDVLLREKCTPSTDVDGRDPCRPTEAGDIEARVRTPRSDDESLRSFIRVSQVYP